MLTSNTLRQSLILVFLQPNTFERSEKNVFLFSPLLVRPMRVACIMRYKQTFLSASEYKFTFWSLLHKTVCLSVALKNGV